MCVQSLIKIGSVEVIEKAFKTLIYRSIKKPRTWQLGQLNDRTEFLVSRSLTLPSAPS